MTLARGEGNPSDARGGGDPGTNMLVIDLTGLQNVLVLSKRFPEPVRAKHAAVCDILRLAMRYATPKTRVVGQELSALTPTLKRALALEYIKELETVLAKILHLGLSAGDTPAAPVDTHRRRLGCIGGKLAGR